MRGGVTLFWGDQDYGERHIVIGHGYDLAAQARTRAALEGDPIPVRDARGGYRYYFPLEPASGFSCRQKVVVSGSATIGVITSFVEAY